MSHIGLDIYGGRDPREIPTYNIAEAARYLRFAPATLRSWVIGRSYPLRDGTAFFSPLIQPPDSSENVLSFSNLVEAHVLWSLRTKHGVSIKAVREALQYAQRKLRIKRLLLSKQLCTDAADLFLDRYSELINLSRSGQLVMRKFFEAYLSRIEWDRDDLPARLYPFVRTHWEVEAREIVIDPFISFGRPIIKSKSITTAIIVSRIDAGETVPELAKDYDLNPSEIESAYIYEGTA
ncbi:MAG: DUF433 domain-containing protein [Calditrichaeota bacterium]|nr:DUF433 domain-containing protein [Calditrichota bacterium]